jgi:large subunit ribosomal protein L22
MEVKAKAKNIRISPTKVRLVINLIRGKNAPQALKELQFIHKKAAFPVLKVLKSALSNAKNNYSLDDKNLYIAKIQADPGPVYKRVKFRARGRRDIIRKRTTHITVILEEVEKEVRKRKLTEEAVEEEIAKEEKIATVPKETAQAETPSSVPVSASATPDKKATEDKQKKVKTQREKAPAITPVFREEEAKEKIEKIEKVKKEEKPEIKPEEKKRRFWELKKGLAGKKKLTKKESFIKKFFRRKSV